MLIKRASEICILVSLCLTVAYCAAAFTGQIAFNRFTCLILVAPLLMLTAYNLLLRLTAMVVWLIWQQLGYVDDEQPHIAAKTVVGHHSWWEEMLEICVVAMLLLGLVCRYALQPDDPEMGV